MSVGRAGTSPSSSTSRTMGGSLIQVMAPAAQASRMPANTWWCPSRSVAIGRDPRDPVGATLEPHRSRRRLRWFAKTALFVRGTGEVVVRVPSDLTEAVRIAGWTQPRSDRTAEAALVKSTSDCPDDWTAYPGGLVFRGRHYVRLHVIGPGAARGSVLVGLRTDCARDA